MGFTQSGDASKHSSLPGSVLCPWNAFCIVSLAATFLGRKERNFSPKRLRLKARRSSTRPNQPSDPSKARPTPRWSEQAGSAQTQPTHWTCVVVAAADVSGQKRLRSAPEAGQRQGRTAGARPGRAGCGPRGCVRPVDRARSCPPASGTYIKVTSTSLIKR